jgi:hypothetical protein
VADRLCDPAWGSPSALPEPQSTHFGMSDRPEPSVQDLSAGIAIAIADRGRSSALRAGLEADPEGHGEPRQDEVAIERRRKEQRNASKQRQVLITCVRALTRQV